MMNYEDKEISDLIFGTRAVIEAVRSGKEINKIMVQKGLSNDLFNELKNELKGMDVTLQFVPIEKLNRLTRKNHQGVIGFISPVTYHKVEELLPGVFESGKVPFLLMLDRVTDVRNFGAICRTAECMGIDAVIIPSRGGALITSDAVKTSAGALHRIPVCKEDNLKKTIHYLSASGLRVVSCTEKAEKQLDQIDYSDPLCIIMGSEEDGISGEYLKLSDEKVKIPMIGNIESLNVSVAAGMIMYEAVRQRIASGI
ncbi:MAG: 23S rRNA (guanosine(2251)-2'-O)-methyltransferase RlmB [Flavobacteriales bacterium]|nr:23S rRNA (guanosine(2251)-2'-O)-methyltransferase RlmB [Flavobacteriales bacterium]